MNAAERWRNRFSYTNVEHVLRAVVAAFDEIESTHGKASAERWTLNAYKYRPMMVGLVRKHWSAETGLSDDKFPFDDDFVAQVYIDWRKNSDQDEIRDDFNSVFA